jgi:hypothetical protein
MADVGPEIEMKALRDDFATAKYDDPRLWCSLALAFDHLSKSLEALAQDPPKPERFGEDHALFSNLEHGRTQNRTPFFLIALQAK